MFAGRWSGLCLIMCSDEGAPIETKAVKVSLLPDAGPGEAFAQASRFREDLFDCLTARGDELFELVDALLCADGPVTSPVDLTLVAKHRRGHGAMYEALNHGNVDVPRLRQVLAGLPMPRAADGRLVLAVDVSVSRPAGSAAHRHPAHPRPPPPSLAVSVGGDEASLIVNCRVGEVFSLFGHGRVPARRPGSPRSFGSWAGGVPVSRWDGAVR